MATWTTARDELRALLSDGPTDKLAHRKAVLGDINGTNTKFKTLEFRRVTNFTSASSPLGVFVAGAAVTVSADDVSTGEFNLSAAPADGSELRCTYYYQWFLDSELDGFLKDAARFVAAGETIGNTIEQLRQAALQYAAYDAYQKLALRWAQRLSEVYRLEDEVDGKAAENPFFKLATACRKCAMDLRDDYYKRQGQQFQPAYGFSMGNVQDTVPKR